MVATRDLTSQYLDVLERVKLSRVSMSGSRLGDQTRKLVSELEVDSAIEMQVKGLSRPPVWIDIVEEIKKDMQRISESSKTALLFCSRSKSQSYRNCIMIDSKLRLDLRRKAKTSRFLGVLD
jgi:hypothetical protein